jgi:hypothetical protein
MPRPSRTYLNVVGFQRGIQGSKSTVERNRDSDAFFKKGFFSMYKLWQQALEENDRISTLVIVTASIAIVLGILGIILS